MNDDKQLEVLERLSLLANVLQVGSFVMNEQQISNDELMKVLELQNRHYLEGILANQRLILEKLNKLI